MTADEQTEAAREKARAFILRNLRGEPAQMRSFPYQEPAKFDQLAYDRAMRDAGLGPRGCTGCG